MMDFGKQFVLEFGNNERVRWEKMSNGTVIIFHEFKGGRGNWSEPFLPLKFKSFLSDIDFENSEMIELAQERVSIEADNHLFETNESAKIKSILKAAIESGKITLRRYRRWRAQMGLKDTDQMNEFQLTVLAGELYKMNRGGVFAETPF